jgi:hypothetical protein
MPLPSRDAFDRFREQMQSCYTGGANADKPSSSRKG